MDNFGYSNLTACTQVPDNSTYLNNTHYRPAAEPMSGSTMGLMMLLSTLQYQPTYLSPQYQGAANTAGRAAYQESGGDAMQKRATDFATKTGTDMVHSVGITDSDMGKVGAVYGIYKVYQAKQIDINGPRIYVFKTHLTANEHGGSIGLKYEW